MTKTILVVEDERSLQAAIKTKLEKSGFNVATARSTSQALKILTEKGKVDAIWLDHYLLGGESGLDLVIKLKKDDSEWKKIPVFIVSNTASNEKVRAYMRLGVEKYFTKSDHRLEDIIKEVKNL